MKLTMHRQDDGTLTVADELASVTLPRSFVPNVNDLAGLADAVTGLLNGADRMTWVWPVGSWYTPPGEYRWLLDRQDDTVRLTMLWFDEPFSRRPDEAGVVVFVTECKLQRLAVQVKNELDRLLAEQGHPNTELRRWAYQKLDGALHRTKAH